MCGSYGLSGVIFLGLTSDMNFQQEMDSSSLSPVSAKRPKTSDQGSEEVGHRHFILVCFMEENL